MHIYSKYFRGNPDGWTVLEDGNFLVGENSTGKSSFGRLLRIIWSSEFQYNNICVLRKSALSDYYSYRSKLAQSETAKDGFTIGFLAQDKDSKDGSQNFFGKLCTYVEINGDIKLNSLSQLQNGKITKITFEKGKILRKEKIYSKRYKVNSLKKFFSKLHQDKVNSDFDVIELPTSKRPPAHFWTVLIPLKELKIDANKQYRGEASILDGAGRLIHMGPIRSKAERVYFVGTENFDPEGRASLGRIRKLSSNSSFKKAMVKFGKASGLYDNFDVIDLSEELQRNAFSIKFKRNGREFFADELGFGISQVIPLLAETLIKRKSPVILIEQPELHLHPKAQAAFGDLLFQFMLLGGQFIAETHSDYLIDRFRVAHSANQKCDETSQILFFYRMGKKNALNQIRINREGQLDEPPLKYREFFLEEQMSVFDAI